MALNTSGQTLAAQRYLDAASTLLLATSPHTSAFVASQRQRLSQSASHSTPHNCHACGHILVAGWSCKLIRSSKSKSNAPARICYECSLCHGVNSFKSSTEPLSRRAKTKKMDAAVSTSIAPVSQPSAATKPALGSAPASATPTPAAAEDQPRPDRKRNRKQKQGGLKAMLAKSKAEAAAPSAFDLMDFMKMA